MNRPIGFHSQSCRSGSGISEDDVVQHRVGFVGEIVRRRCGSSSADAATARDAARALRHVFTILNAITGFRPWGVTAQFPFQYPFASCVLLYVPCAV